MVCGGVKLDGGVGDAVDVGEGGMICLKPFLVFSFQIYGHTYRHC